MKSVTFKSSGLTLAGNLFYPENFQPNNQPISAIVVAHPGAGVKEQTAGLYAKNLAEKGFITLAFDAAYQGESEGMPRGFEDPTQRIEDIKSAVAFLTTLKEVDATKIGVLGICASGGYTLVATATDHNIKAVATVSGVDLGDWYRKGADGKQDPSFVQGMLDAAAADRIADTQGSFPVRVTEEQAKAMGGINPEGWEYYCTDRGQHPNQTNFMPWKSVERIVGFYSPHFVHLIAPRPVLMIAGENAQTLWMTKEAYEKSNEPKELFLIEGETHVSLYDNVSKSLPKLETFFKSNL
ncbi:MAG: alpha/beta hydrolase [Bacteroidetes bacterium]|nr:alpha/beta hydrolase [Bacteroidota bacterium]